MSYFFISIIFNKFLNTIPFLKLRNNYELLVPEGARSYLVEHFVRGDCLGDDGSVTAADMTYLLGFLFQGGSPLSCQDACDANDDGAVDVADVGFMSLFIYQGGSNPAAPFPGCGGEPTFDPLNCETYACP